MDEAHGKPADPKPAAAGSARAQREARLAKALRDNLRRRKGAPAPDSKRPDGA